MLQNRETNTCDQPPGTELKLWLSLLVFFPHGAETADNPNVWTLNQERRRDLYATRQKQTQIWQRWSKETGNSWSSSPNLKLVQQLDKYQVWLKDEYQNQSQNRRRSTLESYNKPYSLWNKHMVQSDDGKHQGNNISYS